MAYLHVWHRLTPFGSVHKGYVCHPHMYRSCRHIYLDHAVVLPVANPETERGEKERKGKEGRNKLEGKSLRYRAGPSKSFKKEMGMPVCTAEGPSEHATTSRRKGFQGEPRLSTRQLFVDWN